MTTDKQPEHVRLAVAGRLTDALNSIDHDNQSATERLNHRLLSADLEHTYSSLPTPPEPSKSSHKIAIVSLLFNWPSTGGGIVHTAELGQFLTQAGYEVCHFYAEYAPWEMGRVTETLPYSSVTLKFVEFLSRHHSIRWRSGNSLAA